MWARLLNICLGVWLMAAPSVLGYGGAARTNSTVVGALAASFACVALWEATRPLRWVNFALGLWLAVTAMALGSGAAAVNGALVGILMAAAARAGGEVKGRYGGGWAALWRSESKGERGRTSHERGN